MEGNNSEGENELNPLPSPLQGEGAESLMQPENQLSQNLPQQDLPPQQNQQNIDVNTLTLLLNLLQKVNSERGAKAKPNNY